MQNLTSFRVGGLSEVIEPSNPLPFTSKALELAFSTPEKRYTVAQVFAKLRKLSIVDFSSPEMKVEQPKQVAKAVKAILAHARELEYLYLPEIGDYDYSTDAVHLSMWNLIPFYGLPCIQKLDLHRVAVKRRALIGFCEFRSEYLVTVFFYYVKSEDATWAAIVDGLRTLKWPHLQRFSINYCGDPETPADKHDYRKAEVGAFLLHKTDENPRMYLEKDQASSDESNSESEYESD